MRQRMRVSKTLSMTEKMAEDVQSVADEFDVSFADVVRGMHQVGFTETQRPGTKTQKSPEEIAET